MSALMYLLLTRFKNTLKGLIAKPSRLILTIAIIAMIGFTIYAGTLGGPLHSVRDRGELYAILFLLFGLMFMLTAVSGLSSGASFFSMSDVNLLFSAPISPRRVLNYGLIRQLGNTLLMGFFIFFQYSWLANSYGIKPQDLIAIFLGYGLSVFCGQMTAMSIYSYSSSDDRKKGIIRAILYLACGLVIAFALYPALGSGDMLGAAIAQVNTTPFGLIPFAGWLANLTMGLISGNLMQALTGLIFTLAFALLFLTVILRKNADYYEDVLAATEVSFSAITAKKEGRMPDATGKKVKKGKIGLQRGAGANAFFFKHLLENRRARVLFLDLNTLIFCASSIILGYFMRELGLIAVLSFVCYMMIFSSFLGRWTKELLLPYVYLVPEKPFFKLIMICGETMLKSLVEAAVIFIPLAFILKLSPVETFVCVLIRLGISLAFIAATVLTERLFGALPIKSIQMLLYFLIIILLIAPGVVLAVLLSSALSLGLVGGLLLLFVYLVLASALVIFLCREMLNYAELNNQ